MPKKILIIDDSALMRRVISDIINEGNEYEVAAIAKDGVEGFDLIVSNPTLYSAVILDINMPKMNGLQLLEKLQKNRIEQTVIVVSTVAKEGAKETIQALEYGAFDFVTKPENYLETKGDAFKKRIHEMLDVATSTKQTLARVNGTSVRPASRVSLNRKTADADTKEQGRTSGQVLSALRSRMPEKSSTPAKKVDGKLYTDVKKGKLKIIALACSTGGPKSLQQVIPMLPKNLDAGLVLVQHMPAGFTASLAARLDEMSDVKVKEAQEGDIISKGCVYIAPGGRHLRIARNGLNYRISLSDEPAIDGLRPCANVMYESLAQSDFDEITCVVLTGMGADGTKGIKTLAAKNKKIHVIAQDEDTSVVYGMPKAIAQSGLVDEVVPLERVADAITKNVGVS
jgi:two-component system chemotaxis response regulator CheB